jgi:hypothetical protein
MRCSQGARAPVDLSMPFRIQQVRDKIAQETSAMQANKNPKSSPKIPNGAAARVTDGRSRRVGGGGGEGDGVARLTIHFDQDVDYSLGPSVSRYTHTHHRHTHTHYSTYHVVCSIFRMVCVCV